MSMRFVMRPDAYHVAVEDGVFVLSNAGSVRLTGGSVAQWVDRLAPHLSGQRTLSDLTAELSPERRAIVERLVATLHSRDVVRVRGVDEPNALDAAVSDRYACEVSFIGYFRDSAGAAFARYRTASTLVVGAGPLLLAVVRAALHSGLRVVRAVTTGEEPTDLARLARIEQEARRRDPEQRLVHQRREELGAAPLAELVDNADLVLHVGGGLRMFHIRLLETCCARAGVPLTQAVAREGEVWMVPIADAGAPRWSAAQPRLRTPAPLHPPSRAGHAAPTTVIASQLVHAAFRALTGIGGARDPSVLLRFDLATLRTEEHRYLPHPFALPAAAATEAAFRARLAELARGERLTEESFSQRAARTVDDQLGIVSLHEHDWAQSPLHVTEARAYDPVGLLSGRTHVVTTRAGLTHRTARCGATMRGLVHYGELMVDPRRLVTPAGRPIVTRADSPRSALAELRAGSNVGATWGYDIAVPDRVRLVQATAVFPRLRTSTPVAAATAGLAAGFDWTGAVMAGLLGHCRRLTLDEIGRGPPTYPSIDLASMTLDEVGTRCRNLLAGLGELPEAYEVTGALGVPTYAFCSGPNTVAYATGATASSAVGTGLVQVLRAVQGRVHAQPGIMPPAVPHLPQALRGTRDGRSSADRFRTWGVADIAVRLRATGRIAVAVPLDHDPEVARIMPYLVNVVMCND